jgi:ribosomal protein S18 acetylase RimI-like enzyme
VDPALAVFDEGLGPGYLIAADLRALVAADESEAGVYVALADGAVAGAALVDRAPVDVVARISAEAGAAGHPRPDLATRRVGRLRTGAVRPPYRRRGIGRALMEARLDRLRATGCTAVVALAWLSGDRDTSVGLLRAHGLERVAEIPGYWQADPPDSGPPCPVCAWPCRCVAAVHVALW